jgi:hypothetical protein
VENLAIGFQFVINDKLQEAVASNEAQSLERVSLKVAIPSPFCVCQVGCTADQKTIVIAANEGHQSGRLYFYDLVTLNKRQTKV